MKKLIDFFTLLLKRFISVFALLSTKLFNVGSMNMAQPRMNMTPPRMNLSQQSLADDIILIEILTRLPGKSLLLFRSVCKLWKSLYLNPDFIKYHIKHISRNPNDEDDNLILKRSGVNGSVELAILSSSSLSEIRLFDFPYSRPPSSHAHIYLIGSVKGLVCLFLPQLKQFVLWNPAIRQAMKINSPVKQFMLRDDVSASFYGFCWDAIENDFIVVNCYSNKKLGNHSLYIYSCNSGFWSLLNNFTLPGNQTYFRVPSVTVNGLPYWNRTWFSWRNDMKLHMIKFEVGSKKFKVLPVLDLFGSNVHIYPVAINLKESLYALAFKTCSPYSLVDVYCYYERCSIWSKKYNIIGPIAGPVHALLGCFRYGDVIVFNISGKYKCYDHKTNKTKDLGNQDGQLTDCISYKTSLVFLEGMKPQHQVDPILWK